MSQNRKEVIDCSVIIPHFNQINELIKCLDALKKQATQHSYEIIIVNNFNDASDERFILDRFPNVRWIESKVYNPYTSRNIGVKASQTPIIAFLDAKCIPSDLWIEKGVSFLFDHPDEIVAGKYDVITDPNNLSDLIYPLLYLNNEKNVNNGYGITAGNFMTSRKVFVENGAFLDEIPTGNDIEWSKRCLLNQVKINYLPGMTVLYKGQPFDQLKRSVAKYISGVKHLHLKENHSPLNRLEVWLKYLLPMRMNNYLEALRYRDLTKLSASKKGRLWLMIWSVKLRMAYYYLFPQFAKKGLDK